MVPPQSLKATGNLGLLTPGMRSGNNSIYGIKGRALEEDECVVGCPHSKTCERIIERAKEELKAEREAIEEMTRNENERLLAQEEEEWRIEREVMERMKREEKKNRKNKQKRNGELKGTTM